MDYKTILRHYLATLAYRTGLAIHDVSDTYIEFDSGGDGWTPKQIMNHMVQLMKAPNDILNNQKYDPLERDSWDDICREFYIQIGNLDNTVQNLENPDKKVLYNMFQGPILDAMTHVGQLMAIHRMSGNPRQALPYYKVDIEAGKFVYDYTEE